MKKITEAVEVGIANILAHESIKVADAAITISALRGGGRGYTGELIQVPILAMARGVAKAVFDFVSYDLKLEDITAATAEERRKAVVELYMGQYDMEMGELTKKYTKTQNRPR